MSYCDLPRLYAIFEVTKEYLADAVTVAFGIITTSAAAEVLGEAYWQPYLLLRAIQKHYNNSASSRAAVYVISLERSR